MELKEAIYLKQKVLDLNMTLSELESSFNNNDKKKFEKSKQLILSQQSEIQSVIKKLIKE